MFKWVIQDLHPLARLNLLILLFFISLQLCAAVILLTSPTGLDVLTAQTLQTIDDSWCLITVLGLFWTAYSATQLSFAASRRYQYTSRRNIIMAWAVPAALILLLFTWRPLIQLAIDYRLESAFDRSREALLVRCDRVLREGEMSPAINQDVEIGSYAHVNILLRDGAVWFDIGDSLRAYGFVCIAPNGTPPTDNPQYEFKRVDARFYEFSEVENLLTPQAPTPNPE
jgi:hypothetical protein